MKSIRVIADARPLLGRGEFRSRGAWRSERSWLPTFSTFAQGFAQLRSSAAAKTQHRLGRQGQGEYRALAGLARYRNVTAHHAG
jgi:hypothetical protein